ncbi:sel1 repeat family protein [Stenotrophomonas maltophilia]|uniref:sel1 repeat family protein n=1 Tax=Stenotrophomonas maltophilia TaxID=40324 RepID=UPI00128BA786|nr:sel1 repeat family protein [Stenotrophomonas maltophilia]
MKKILIVALVLLAAAVGIFVINFVSTGRDTRAEPVEASDSSTSVPDGDTAKPLASLIAQRKLDPTVVQQVGSRAFVVTRNGAFRPSGDAKDFILSRIAASDAGDSIATYEIYLAALDCRNAGSPGELQSAALLPSKSEQQGALESSETRLKECSSLLEDSNLSPPGKWLIKAAHQGSIEAMLLYATDTESAFGGSSAAIQNPEAVAEWKTDADSFLNAAASQGSVDALVALGRANANGIIVKKNPTEALAYYLAAKRAMPSAFSEKLLGMYQKELSAAEQQAAIRRADAIYKNCCQ